MSENRSSVTVRMPDSTLDWLRETYLDATSDSMRVLMAISDARLVRDTDHLAIEGPTAVEIRSQVEPDE